MKNILLILVASVSLVACNKSDDSAAGVPTPQKAEKLTVEITKSFSNFVQDEQKFGDLVSLSVSGDNTFNPEAPKEMRENCKLEGVNYATTASAISIVTFKLTGANCPVKEDANVVHAGNIGFNANEELCCPGSIVTVGGIILVKKVCGFQSKLLKS